MLDDLLDVITRQDAGDYFRVRRWRATAATWFSKVTVSLRWQHDETESDSTRYLLAEEAARLLVGVLQDARQVVPLLRADTMHDFEHVQREAQALVKALRHAELAAKMENTSGRTPAEAEMFREKLAELQGGERGR